MQTDTKFLPFERRFFRWLVRHNKVSKHVPFGQPETRNAFWFLTTPCHGTVAIVHGAGNDALYAQVHLIKHFLRRGLSVFSFDLDGHGRFSNSVFDPALAHQIVPRALEHARSTNPNMDHLPLHLIGISLGGVLALSALTPPPSNLATFCTIGAPANMDVPQDIVMHELFYSLKISVVRQLFTYGPFGILPSFKNFKRRIYPFRFAPSAGVTTANYIEHIGRLIARLVKQLSVTENPSYRSLLLTGDCDLIATPKHATIFQKKLPGSRCVSFPGEGHLSLLFAERLLAELSSSIDAINY